MSVPVLIVEDDATLRLQLSQYLASKGFAPTAVASAEEAVAAVNEQTPVLAILDWNLPRMSGLELLDAWRTSGQHFPKIMLTGHSSVEDRVRALEAGADDYLVKPFAPPELVARIGAVLRRSTAVAESADENMLQLVDRTVDLRQQVVKQGLKLTPLTDLEARTLRFLASRRGEAVARNELLRAVWGFPNAKTVQTRAIDSTVYRLRSKIEATPAEPRYLKKVQGFGYRFDP